MTAADTFGEEASEKLRLSIQTISPTTGGDKVAAKLVNGRESKKCEKRRKHEQTNWQLTEKYPQLTTNGRFMNFLPQPPKKGMKSFPFTCHCDRPME